MDNKVSIQSVINFTYKVIGTILLYKIMVSLQSLVQIAGALLSNTSQTIFK